MNIHILGSLYSKKSRLIKCRLLFYQLRLPLRWKLAEEKRGVVSFLSLSLRFFLLSTSRSGALPEDG